MRDIEISNTIESSINELQHILQDVIHQDDLYQDEFYLLRWLKVGDMNVKKAAKCIRTTANWRAETGISSEIDTPYPDNWLQDFNMNADAVTPDGVLVVTFEMGKVDFQRLFTTIGKGKMVKNILQMFANAESATLALNRKKFGGHPITEQSLEGVIFLADLQNFQVQQLSSFQGIQFIVEVARSLVKYFPFLIHRFIFINCNGLSTFLFNIVRPIMESPSLKFEIYGQDPNEWLESTRSILPLENLPAQFGGNATEDEGLERKSFIKKNLLLH